MKNKLPFFITRATMIGIGFFLIFQKANKDSWISIILGSLIGIIIIYIYQKIKDTYNTKTLQETLNKTWQGKMYIGFFIIFYFYLALIILLLLPLFVNYFYLVHTPKFLINLSFIILTIYIAYKGKFVIENLSNVLFIISIIMLVIFSFSLIWHSDLSNIRPILSDGVPNIFLGSLIYASITSIPQILLLDYSYEFKEVTKIYVITSLFNLFVALLTILNLGSGLITSYSFPEYATIKQIKLLNFIENIENISTIAWYFDMFLMLSLVTTNIKELLPKKYNKLIFIIFWIVILLFSSFILGDNFKLTLQLFYYYPLILFVFFIIFITMGIYLKYKKKNN